jgi:hypothetical protein
MKSQNGTSNIQNTLSQGTYEEAIAPNKIEKNYGKFSVYSQ